MSIVVRHPYPPEWPACRMLLPESFQLGSPPDAFLAWDESRQSIAGVAACHRLKKATIGLSVFTLQKYRRQSIGSQLVTKIVDFARARGDENIRTLVDLNAYPQAQSFLMANGFRKVSRVLQVEGRLDAIAPLLQVSRHKLAAAGKIPQATEIVESRALTRAELLQIYREVVAPDLQGRAALAEFIVTSPAFDATTLRVSDRAAGMLVGVRNNGLGCGSLNAVAVAPEFRSGWGWANVMLLADAAERSLEAGSHAIRFEVDERNWRVIQGIGRSQGVVTAIPARFIRELVAGKSTEADL